MAAPASGSTLRIALVISIIFAVTVRYIGVWKHGAVLDKPEAHFHARSAAYIAENGWLSFVRWVDDLAWYPTGRHVASSSAVGVAAVIAALHRLGSAVAGLLPLPLPLAAVLSSVDGAALAVAPLAAASACVLVYLLARDVAVESEQASAAATAAGAASTGKRGSQARPQAQPQAQQEGTASDPASSAQLVGVCALALFAVAPAYLSRSMAGQVEGGAVGLPCALLLLVSWARAVQQGSLAWAAAAAAAYTALASVWSAYSIVLQVIALHALVLLLVNVQTNNQSVVAGLRMLYLLFSSCAIIAPVALQPLLPTLAAGGSAGWASVARAEYALPLAVSVLHVLPLPTARKPLPLLAGAATVVAVLVALGLRSGVIAPLPEHLLLVLQPWQLWEGGRASLLYSSQAESTPSAWSAHFFGLHLLLLTTPVGLYQLLSSPALRAAPTQLLLVVYTCVGMWCAASQVRLLVLLAPAAAVLSGLAITTQLQRALPLARTYFKGKAPTAPSASAAGKTPAKGSAAAAAAAEAAADDAGLLEFSVFALVGLGILLTSYLLHSVWMAAAVYSAPSLSLTAREPDGSRSRLEDGREALAWLRENGTSAGTGGGAAVLAWQDHGHYITALGGHASIVDTSVGSTEASGGNASQVAAVAAVLLSPPAAAWAAIRVNWPATRYALVSCGGMTGYTGDDISKMPWMIRLAEQADTGALGLPPVRETDFLVATAGAAGAAAEPLAPGEHIHSVSIGQNAAAAVRESTLYGLCYSRFEVAVTDRNRPTGYDRARGAVVAKGRQAEEAAAELQRYFQEVYTSSHWMVRVYAVREQPLPSAAQSGAASPHEQEQEQEQGQQEQEQHQERWLQRRPLTSGGAAVDGGVVGLGADGSVEGADDAFVDAE